jgi:hypothetical protein
METIRDFFDAMTAVVLSGADVLDVQAQAQAARAKLGEPDAAASSAGP